MTEQPCAFVAVHDMQRILKLYVKFLFLEKEQIVWCNIQLNIFNAIKINLHIALSDLINHVQIYG